MHGTDEHKGSFRSAQAVEVGSRSSTRRIVEDATGATHATSTTNSGYTKCAVSFVSGGRDGLTDNRVSGYLPPPFGVPPRGAAPCYTG